MGSGLPLGINLAIQRASVEELALVLRFLDPVNRERLKSALALKVQEVEADQDMTRSSTVGSLTILVNNALSGERLAIVQVSPDSTVRNLRLQAEVASNKPLILFHHGRRLEGSQNLAACGITDVVLATISNRQPGIYHNRGLKGPTATAELLADGTLITYGRQEDGGDSTSARDQLGEGVQSVCCAMQAFAALKEDGSVVTWGRRAYGGGMESYGRSVKAKLSSGVQAICSTLGAFAALKDGGSVVSWGQHCDGSDPPEDKLAGNVQAVFSTNDAFVALKNDGSVVVWGTGSSGGNCGAVKDQLKRGVQAIFSTDNAFAAVTQDDSIVVWGAKNEFESVRQKALARKHRRTNGSS